jgi:hypothetical protein
MIPLIIPSSQALDHAYSQFKENNLYSQMDCSFHYFLNSSIIDNATFCLSIIGSKHFGDYDNCFSSFIWIENCFSFGSLLSLSSARFSL